MEGNGDVTNMQIVQNDDDDDNIKFESNNDGLVVGIIDFPKGGTFGLDGQNIMLKPNNNNNSNFMGVKGIPPNRFHLITCNSNGGNSNNNNKNNTINTAVTVGFIVFGDHHDDHLIRRYDPQTEEVSSNKVDETTKRNLLQQIPMMSMVPSLSNVICYDQIRRILPSSQQQQRKGTIWEEQTRYINESSELLLQIIKGLSSGEKIVPGCYDPDEEEETEGEGDNKRRNNSNHKIEDGICLKYPPIPVIDTNLSLTTHTKHNGTKRFLSRLVPSERTRLFLSMNKDNSNNNNNNNNTFMWLERILNDCYSNSWTALLGDLQLSYLLFLYLGCYSSLDHWKDLLAMLSLAVQDQGQVQQQAHRVNSNHNSRHDYYELYRGLLRLLPYQLSSMVDPEFLEDIDGEGEGNFLLPSLMRLLKYYETNDNNEDNDDDDDDKDDDQVSKFRHVLLSKFPRTFSSLLRPSNTIISSSSMMGSTKIKMIGGSDVRDEDHAVLDNNSYSDGEIDVNLLDCQDNNNDDDDDENGPIVVSSEEIEASLARSTSLSFTISTATTTGTDINTKELQIRLRKEYPLLAAAIMPHEDVLMTCARALDEKNDVSLVREAACYLKEVEQFH